MADTRISALVEQTSVGLTDVLPIVDNSGTPTTKKITTLNLNKGFDHTQLTNIGTNTHAQIDTAIGTIPVKAIGSEVTTGTNDTKFTTPKALADAGITPILVKAAGSDVTTGTNDTKFVTAKALTDAGIVLDATTTLGTSDVKLPTQKAVKTYVDNGLFTTISATSYTTNTGTSLTVATKNTYFLVTAQAGDLKFNNPGGTPADGWKLWISVTGTGARALTYDTQFEASAGVALPTTTVTTARLDIGFVWRADTSKWHCVASA